MWVIWDLSYNSFHTEIIQWYKYIISYTGLKKVNFAIGHPVGVKWLEVLAIYSKTCSMLEVKNIKQLLFSRIKLGNNNFGALDITPDSTQWGAIDT